MFRKVGLKMKEEKKENKCEECGKVLIASFYKKDEKLFCSIKCRDKGV